MTITLDSDRAAQERGYISRIIAAALAAIGRVITARNDDEAIRAALAFDDVQIAWVCGSE